MPGTSRERPVGLFVQVLDWMLAPLVVIWPAAFLATYFAAATVADNQFDRELSESARVVADDARLRIATSSGGLVLPAVEALRNDPRERLYASVARERAVLAGDSVLPWPLDAEALEEGAIRFREEMVGEERVRVAYGRFDVAGGAPLMVQVGEPVRRRQALVGEMTRILIIIVCVLVPLSVALAWFGLQRGLAPLLALRSRIDRRRPDDLSPVPVEEVPAEIGPLVATLNSQLERVKRNLDSQRRFVADAAHQMRTPLAGLKTQAEAALRVGTLGEARERLQRIEESADRLNRLMVQLLALARADDAMAQALPREPVDVDALAREVCAGCADRALAKPVSLGFDAAAGPVPVMGQPLLLREMLANLVDNAIRYTPPGGEVAVRVQADPPRVAVEDTGIGIPEAERPLVFERFHRVLGTGESGSGLGLSIVRAIADWHGATVAVEPGPGGVGTRFTVRFAT